MTVPVQTPINSYVYAGGSSFVYSFQLLQSTDLLVTVDGVTKTLGVDYTIAGVGVQAGGTVNYLTSISVGQLVSLSRQTSLARASDYQTLGDFLAGTINTDFDRLWMALQERATNDTRSIRAPSGETLAILPAAASRAGFLLGFDGSGGVALIAAAAQSATALALNLLSSTGSTFVSFLQAGAGMVLRALQLKLQEQISTKDAGAVADGVTNDATAVTNANTRAAAVGAPLLFLGVHHIGSPITITAPIVDTLSQIFSLTSQVTIANGLPVRPEWWGIGNQNTIALAIAALPSAGAQIGGDVLLRNAVYLPNNFVYGFGGAGKNISKDNVRLLGAGMPQWSADLKGLVAGTGTIIQGPLLGYANNLEVRDLGVDSGFNVCTTYNGGVATVGSYGEGLEFTYPNDAVKAANAIRSGLRVHNVVALSLSPTATVHAMILGEGYTDVNVTGRVVAIYGQHGCAFKGSDVKTASVTTYLNGGEGIVIKSDTQTTAVSTRHQHGHLVANGGGPTGSAPYVAAPGTGYGLAFQCLGNNIDEIQIDCVRATGYPIGIGATFSGTSSLSGVEIGEAITDNASVAGTTQGVQLFSAAGQLIQRVNFGSIAARNCTVGFQPVFPQPADADCHVNVGRLEVTNATQGVDIGSAASVSIGTVVADTLSDAVYRVTGTPKLAVGLLHKDVTTPALYSSASGGLVPSLSNSWTQVASNDPFGIDILGGRIELRGLVKPGTTNVLTTLPLWARPITAKRYTAQAYNGTTVVAAPVTVGSDGTVTVNEIAGGFANCTSWLSLSGITFDQQA